MAVASAPALVLVPICETLARAVLTVAVGAAASGCPGLEGAAVKLGPERKLAPRVFQSAVLPL